MALEEENTSPAINKEPTPLSLEGATVQLDLPIKPPAATKATPVSFNKPGLIKEMMSTPKESGSDNPSTGSTSNTSSSGSKVPPKDNSAIISSLSSGDDSGSSKGPPPTTDETNDTAGMIIDGFNAIFLIAIQAWSKDARSEDYEVETPEKNKLKKYLSSIFFKAETKINPIWLFIGLLFITYIPKLQAAWNHRKIVSEEREKNKPGATIITNPTRKRRRRSSFDDSDTQDHPYVEVK